MADPKNLQDAKEGRKSVKKLIIVGTIVVFLLFMGILTATGNLFPITDPLAQFTTRRQCSFLVMGDVSKAVCTDGTVWNITQIGGPSPLP